MEMSLQLLQPIVYTPLINSVTAGVATAEIASTTYLYPGALLVVDLGTPNAEVITVASVISAGSPPVPAFTAAFSQNHVSGALVQGATFPSQATAGDFLYQTSEILGYLSRAQNEFLADVPCMFQFSSQTVPLGQMLNPAPSNNIQIARIASSNVAVAIISLTRSNNVVSAVTSDAHNLSQGSELTVINCSLDASYNGSFQVATVVNSTTVQYPQVGNNSTVVSSPVTPVALMGLWTRLYEVSQQELSNQNPSWRNQHIAALRNWGEDRSGLYGWFVGGIPASNFPVEVLSAIRDTDSLGLLDGFEVPDVCLHGVRWLALSYALSKDGEFKDERRAAFCRMRYQRVVLAVQRLMTGLGMIPPLQGPQQSEGRKR
jgi:hypothetical protein